MKEKMYGIGWMRLYQTEWHGIKLKEIAEKRGVSTKEIAASDFYDEFYHNFCHGGDC